MKVSKCEADIKIWEVDFQPMYPVGGALIIAAEDKEEAERIAEETIIHTDKFSVKEIEINGSGVIIYVNGDY